MPEKPGITGFYRHVRPPASAARDSPPRMRWKSLDPFEIDIFALQVLASLPGVYFPWTGWAMRPSDLVVTLNEILLNRRRCILELGSGASDALHRPAAAPVRWPPLRHGRAPRSRPRADQLTRLPPRT